MLEERRTEADAGVASAGGDGATVASAYRDWFTWVVAALVFGAYTVISLFRLLTLTPSSWDLGIYTEYVKQYADLRAPIVDIRGPGFNLLGDHFQVIVGLLAPFFRIFPSPATLLVAQALQTAVSVFPVVQAGFAVLGPGRSRGRAIGVAYGFSWGLQQMINFDFHEIAFAVPLLAFSLSALVRGKYRSAILWALPLVFVKEDQGFTVAAIGLYLVFAGRRAGDWRRMRGGVFLTAWGLAWSLLAIAVIIPHFNPQHEYYYWSKGGVVGGSSAFSPFGLARQTVYAWPVKLQTSVLLLLPTAFVALGSPIALLTLPSIALRFMSTDSSYWGTDWHYNATVMPILFIAAIEVMGRWGTRSAATSVSPLWRQVTTAASRHGAAMMVAVSFAMAFQFPLSSLWHGSTYTISSHVQADNAAMARVPDGATVTTTLTLLAPLAARTDTFWIGNAGNPLTSYIVFDGETSGYSPAPSNVTQFIEQQLYRNDGYRQVFEDDDVYVFERG
ncbi:MAG TPA: DUF2079 domain-containing protein [Trebonia sp.]|jgi:uncharacterized membrane protein|nr:DUF2079 domain-containing protein [Trebonia sp.]